MAMMTTIMMTMMMIMMPTLSFQHHSGNVHPSWLRMTESARGHKKTFAIHICMSWKSLHFSTKSCPIYHLHWLRSSVMNGHGCGLWPRFKWRRCPKMIQNCGRPWITLGHWPTCPCWESKQLFLDERLPVGCPALPMLDKHSFAYLPVSPNICIFPACHVDKD